MIRAQKRDGRATRRRVATLVASGVLTAHEGGARRSIPGLDRDSPLPQGVRNHVRAFIKELHTQDYLTT